MTHFPEGFLWGTSTAGHQIEGSNTNSDYWLIEQLDDSPFSEPSGDAIRFREHWRTDIALLASLGLCAFRFSIEWSRIEPEEGVFDLDALRFYRELAEGVRASGMIPVITYNHFTLPLWFSKTGGWLRSDAPELFARYCLRVHNELGALIGLACTLNEPNITAHGAVVARMNRKASATDTQLMGRAARAAGSARFFGFFFVDGIEARPNLIRAHRFACDALKSAGATYPIGLALNLRDYQLAEQTDRAREWHAAFLREGHDAYYEACVGDDFLGVQYYSRRLVGSDGVMPVPEGTAKTQMEEEDYPEGIENVIRQAAEISSCPIYVTENGIPTNDDARRIGYIQTAIDKVSNCLRDGLDVRGYFYWSAFDNYEWMSGYEPKFGLIAIDQQTYERKKKPSASCFVSLGRESLKIKQVDC